MKNPAAERKRRRVLRLSCIGSGNSSYPVAVTSRVHVQQREQLLILISCLHSEAEYIRMKFLPRVIAAFDASSLQMLLFLFAHNHYFIGRKVIIVKFNKLSSLLRETAANETEVQH